MKKMLSISMMSLLIILLSGSFLLAKDRAPKNYLTFSFFVNPVSIGYKHLLFDNVYAAGNLDYHSSINDLELQTGAVYLVPLKIIIFRFYGGGGVQFSRNEGYQYPYVTVGTNFLFLFSEIIHPLDDGLEPRYRFGFSFKF